MSVGNGVQQGSRSGRVFAVTLASLVVSFLLVFARLFTRITILKRTSWDDYFIFLAWLLAFGLSFAICFGTRRGLGKHDVDIRQEWQTPLRFSEYFFSVLYNPALMATKTSILIFYLKLSETQKLFRWASLVTLMAVNVGGLALTVLNIAQCKPVSATFKEPSLQQGKCTDIVTLYLSSAPVNVITDLAILFLPMPILTGLRLPRKQKNILVFVFGLGGFVAVVDVVRIAYLQHAASQSLSQRIGGGSESRSRGAEQHDFFWNASLSFMWSAIEVNVGIICACIPTLKPLMSRYVPRMLRDDAAESSGSLAKMELDFVRLQKASSERLPARPGKCQRAPPSAASDHDCERGGITMFDFITTPNMKEPPAQEKPPTHTKKAKTDAIGHSAFNGGFMVLRPSQSMVKMTKRESFLPLAQISLLFFLWGFAYGLLDILNSQFQIVVQMSFGQTMGLHSAYFGAYFVAPLSFGRIVLKKWGFKATFITGLCIYACGTLIFWPSAVLTSFPAFLVSNFIVGLGLSTLEIAANPFIALCGPPEYSEIRLNIAQGVQAIGSVVSPILARRVLFKQILDAPSLVDVQWTYLGIALFDILLAVAFYYLPLPEASDADLEEAATSQNAVDSARIGAVKVVFLTLALGAFSQWCYVGGQETVSMAFSYIVKYLKPGTSTLKASDFQAIGHAVFALGRFSAAFVCMVLTPRKVLFVFYLGCVVSSVLAMKLSGNAGLALLILVHFFESAIWPTIFAISLRGLGSRTKTGSCLLTVGASGGAVFPVFLTFIVQSRPQSSMYVAVAAYSLALVFPIYLNTVTKAKKQVDPIALPGRPPTSSSRSSRRFGLIRRIRNSAEASVTEHVEKAQWR